jgi:putative flippase GtrA
LFDVVKHIHVLISQFIFIAIRFLWFFIFHQWLRFWELNE